MTDNDGMDVDLAVRTLQALATFEPNAPASDIPRVAAELRAALDLLALVTRP